jgi:hypothetical protein
MLKLLNTVPLAPSKSLQLTSVLQETQSPIVPNSARHHKRFGIDETSHTIWDRPDYKAKSIILGYTTPDSSRRTAPPKTVAGKPSFKSTFNLQANLHDISAYAFLIANMHDVLLSDYTPDKENTVNVDESHPAEDTLGTRLINDAKSSVKHILPGVYASG